MNVHVIIALCCLALVGASKVEPKNIETVPELDIEKYLGRWYNVLGNRIARFTYGPDAVCITATYGVYNSSTVTVYNNNRVEYPTGEKNFLCGHAYRTEEPGQLLVQFVGRNNTGNYWVSKLGPQGYGEDKLYDYAIVSGESVDGPLFVLARDPEEFLLKYLDEVLVFLDGIGFNEYLNEPIPIYQGNDCFYPPMENTDCDQQ